ncbi:hypothetical protein [Nannocystis sp. SCPEA4]|uniref:hypothetical protein n=1 Tax=Nannocystis sp. SCPEA4 TaxID=2996787 RepID=UPI00226D675C|nr:hypothetical protein [Nannocystis sp. SCPEA4]MCY1055267.1 hypothetical protein [Nannocystis sp. SCPEA4]
MHKIALIRALVATACALPILAAGCKDEPIPLFDEEGTWVLSLFALEDGDPIGGFGSSLRQDKYMIFYDKDAKIVATAACNDSMGEQGLKTSQCDLPKEQGGYYCRCFNYEFDETLMTWTEFVPKGQPTPPAPSEEDVMNGVVPPDAGVRIALEEYSPDTYNDTYRYTPLPFGVFDSNGTTSQFIFQARSVASFDVTGCREVCGIGAEAEM